jgi:hypothetical protein
MIYQTIDNASQFRDQFHQCGRGDQFSYEALGLLFDYLEDCGSDVELDVVGICCEFSEDTVENIADYYSIDISECDGDYYAISGVVSQYLEDQGVLIGETPTGFVYRQF